MSAYFIVFLVAYIACVCLISARVVYVWFAVFLDRVKALDDKIELIEEHIKVLVAANPNIAFASDLPDETFYGADTEDPNSRNVNKEIETLYPGMYDNGTDWLEIERIKLRAEGG